MPDIVYTQLPLTVQKYSPVRSCHSQHQVLCQYMTFFTPSPPSSPLSVLPSTSSASSLGPIGGPTLYPAVRRK